MEGSITMLACKSIRKDLIKNYGEKFSFSISGI